jgi:hypothetical protein
MMVTWHELICIAGVIIGLGLTAFGGAETFAFMMSDNPTEGQADSNRSCFVSLVGVVILVASIAGFWL